MKNEDLLKESIHLILNYHNRSIIVELKKYKTLIHVKQKVFDLFFPVKNNINVYFNNKNLEPLVNQPIGYIFSGKTLVNLKVVDEGVINTPFRLVNRFQDSFYTTNDLMSKITKKNFNLEQKSNSKSKDNKLSKINSEKNTIINKSLMLNKNKLLLLKGEVNNNNNINNNKNIRTNKKLFNSSSVDNLNIKKSQSNKKKLKLPLIPQKNNGVKNNNNKNNNDNVSIIYNKCNDCYINKITIYCRQCDKFLCNNCALNKKSYHIEHKNDFLTLIPNSNRANIKQYKNIIYKQLKTSLSSFDNKGNKIKTKENNENENDNEEEENKEDNLENDNFQEEKENNFNYNEIISKISKNIYKLVDKAQEIKDNLKDIDFSQIKDSNEAKIKAICDNEKKVLRKMDCFEYLSPFQPFFILNTYERNMAKYFNSYGVSNDERIFVKTKIELMFQNVENEVDNALNEIKKIIGDKEL